MEQPRDDADRAVVDAGGNPDGASKFVKSMLEHQARLAIDLLGRCERLWLGLKGSKILKDELGGAEFSSPGDLIQVVMGLNNEGLQGVMLEVRAVFGDFRTDFRAQKPEPDLPAEEAKAVVAVHLLCICLLVRIQSPVLVSGLPQLESQQRVNLLASLIGMAMTGGRLVLTTGGDEADIPYAEVAYEIDLRHENPTHCFERQLHTWLVRGRKPIEDSQKVGPLSPQERANLKQRLISQRGKGERMTALCVVVYAEEFPGNCDFNLVTDLNVPVFSLHGEIAYELLGGISVEDVMAILRELWRTVGEDMRNPSAQRETPAPTLPLKPSLEEDKSWQPTLTRRPTGG